MKHFGDWLKEEMEKKNLSQKELAEMSNITPAQISRIINGTRGAGEQAIVSIAHALKLPPETVFRAAGLLPPQSPEDELMNEIMHLASDLPAQDKQDILEYVRMRNRLAEERGKNESRTQRKPATP